MRYKRLKRPRFLQWLYAITHGYFWLPCPLCGRKFGGHEDWGHLATSYNRGTSVCIECADEAERLNKANNYFLHQVRYVMDADGVRRENVPLSEQPRWQKQLNEWGYGGES